MESRDDLRRQVEAALPAGAIEPLRAGNVYADWAVLVGAPLLLLANIVFLGVADFGFMSVAAMLLQSQVVMWMAYIYHDVLVHRNAVTGRAGRFFATVLTLPALITPTGYRHGHLRHHRHLHTPMDSELYKADLDTRAKRLLFATGIGVKLAMSGRFAAHRGRRYMPLVDRRDAPTFGRFMAEKRFVKYFSFGVLPLLFLASPKAVGLGYLLPVLLGAPALNTLRVILEHFECDPGNPLALGTFYRTGPVSRLVFFWNGGDCHLVHHLYPGIPFYRMGRAVRLIAPVLVAQRVAQRTRLLPLLGWWFAGNHPHATPLPAEPTPPR